MESIDRMRAAHKKMENPGTIPHPISDEEMELGEHDRSLREILADKREQNRFINKFLYEQDPEMAKEIADALADEHVLTEEQEKWMEAERKSYNTRCLEVEKVRELLDGENVEHLASLDPRIQLIVGKIGAEKAAGFLGNEFGDLAFSDSKAFKRMVGAMRGLHDMRTRTSTLALERDFRTQLHEYGISEDDYFAVTKDGLTLDTKDKLGGLVASQYGFFKKALDFVSAGALSHRAGRALYTTFAEQKMVMEESDKHMKAIGKVLRMTLNEDTRLAIQRFMLEGGTIEEKKEKETIETIGDYRKAKHENDSGGTQGRFEAFKAMELKKRGVRDITKQPHLIDELKEDFATQEFERQGKHKTKGLFAILMAMLFRTKDDIKASLT